MAGILDKKTRFMDTILTDQGRHELAKGELRFSFASFSDLGTFYEGSIDDASVASDSVDRIMLEAFSRPQDMIIPEYEADGSMTFPAGAFDIVNGQLTQISGSSNFLKGLDLVTSASSAIQDCINSFTDLRPLRTEESIKRNTGFKLQYNSAEFVISDEGPIPANKEKVKRLSNAESLWQDKKLTHVQNFKYMPPKNKTSGMKLKEYTKLEQPEPLNFDQLQDSLGVSSKFRKTPVAKVAFDKTSLENNLICQVWEITSSSINKLRMIDFGEFEDSDPYSPGKHVFFVGKLFNDSADEKTFINIFTVVFD